MKSSSLASYFLAGALLANGVPHLAAGVTGRRMLTPFGRDSSPPVNALWGSINFGGGYVLARRADRKAGAAADPDGWLVPLLAGVLACSSFGLVYELRKGRHRDRE